MNTHRHQHQHDDQPDQPDRRLSDRSLRPRAVTVRLDPQTYRVTCVPKTVPGWWRWAVTVDDQGAGRWAVVNARGQHLSRTRQWDTEPLPPDRPPGWLGAHRYDLADALRRAARIAPTVDVDGVRPAEAITQAIAHVRTGDEGPR